MFTGWNRVLFGIDWLFLAQVNFSSMFIRHSSCLPASKSCLASDLMPDAFVILRTAALSSLTVRSEVFPIHDVMAAACSRQVPSPTHAIVTFRMAVHDPLRRLGDIVLLSLLLEHPKLRNSGVLDGLVLMRSFPFTCPSRHLRLLPPSSLPCPRRVSACRCLL